MEDDEDEDMFDDLDLSRKPRRPAKEDNQLNIIIVCCEEDPASMNIRENLIQKYNFSKQKLSFKNKPIYNKGFIWLITVDKSFLFEDHIDEQIDAELYIFASKHQSKEGVPSLTVHCPGNWGIAEHGGVDKEVSMCSASSLKDAFVELNNLAVEKKLGIQVTLEVTHHGPLMAKRPCFFIEIGSTIDQWVNQELGRAMAEAIIRICEHLTAKATGKKSSSEYEIALGIGGPHYANNFNKIQLNSNVAIGHICPKYQLGNLDEETLRKAVQMTKEKVNFILADWKGLGEHKEKIKSIVEKLGYKLKKTNEIDKSQGNDNSDSESDNSDD